MKIMKLVCMSFYATLSAMLFSGCAGMADATDSAVGRGVISEEKSTFDNALIISVSPSLLAKSGDTWSVNDIQLGAQWSEKFPDRLLLVMAHNGDARYANAYINVKRIDINIDGEITSHEASNSTQHGSGAYNTVSKTIYTHSENGISIKYALLKLMVESRDCRLRIYTSNGYEDSNFSLDRQPGGQRLAIVPIRDFVQRVDSVLANK